MEVRSEKGPPVDLKGVSDVRPDDSFGTPRDVHWSRTREGTCDVDPVWVLCLPINFPSLVFTTFPSQVSFVFYARQRCPTPLPTVYPGTIGTSLGILVDGERTD